MDLTTFIENNIRIYSQNSPTEPDGRNPIKLNQQQIILLNHISLFDKLGVVHDRQLGCTTMLAGYIAHWLIYNEDSRNELFIIGKENYILDKVWQILEEAHEYPMAEGTSIIKLGNNKVTCLKSISTRVASKTYGVIFDSASGFNTDTVFDVMSYVKLVKKLIVVGSYDRCAFNNNFMYNLEYDKIFKLQLKSIGSTMPDFPVERINGTGIVNFNVSLPQHLLDRLLLKLDVDDMTFAEYLETMI